MTAVPAELLTALQPPRPSQTVYREECTQCFDSHDSAAGVDVCLHCFNGGCPPAINGVESANGHGRLHFERTGHRVVVNIQRRRKPASELRRNKRDSNEPPVKKLAIREEPSEAEKYDFHTQVRMYTGGEGDRATAQYVVVEQVDEKLSGLVAAVLSAMSSAQRSEVKAWEEEIVPCQHTRELVQPEPKKLEPAGLASCAHADCGLTSNLWLCLTCGALGCGRQQYGGGGGNGHALKHTSDTGHPVAVKLGTIEPDGSADVYCYACDDARIDPNLAKHLANFGIEVAELKKTEKSMTELQVEQNRTFDFAMTGADGKELEPLFGPGLTGMKNLGNSCYMASSLQSVFSLPIFQDRYLTSFVIHPQTCTNPSPATCFECQMSKIADGLLSGRYAVPHVPEPSDALAGSDNQAPADADKPRVHFQEGIRPAMFKALVGKDHAEFSTMRQQDAGEFLQHLLEYIRRASKSLGVEEPTGIFGFAVEERLECSQCHGVRYKTQNEELLSLPVPVKKREVMDIEATPGEASAGGEARTTYEQDKDRKIEYEPVQLTDCLSNLTSPTETEYKCPACDAKVTAVKSTRFSTFPDVLLVNAARFQLDGWVPRKVDVPVVVPFTDLDMSPFVGKGLQQGENELPADKEDAPAEPQFDAEAMNQLTGMGFPEIRAKRALLATGHNGAEVAMNWLFEHMEDPDIDDPLPAATSSASSAAADPSPESISTVCEMGFTPAQARKALRETGGSIERAVEWLFSHPDDDGSDPAPAASTGAGGGAEKKLPGSKDLPARYRLKAFISHKGPSVHSGHYVAHVWTGQADSTGGGKGGWVLFNDEKVVRADEGEQAAERLSPFAYVYVFERVRE
ncbi:ubiquitin C-terminal hydrolase Ubp14 [Rhodotorula toruloides]